MRRRTDCRVVGSLAALLMLCGCAGEGDARLARRGTSTTSNGLPFQAPNHKRSSLLSAAVISTRRSWRCSTRGSGRRQWWKPCPVTAATCLPTTGSWSSSCRRRAPTSRRGPCPRCVSNLRLERGYVPPPALRAAGSEQRTRRGLVPTLIGPRHRAVGRSQSNRGCAAPALPVDLCNKGGRGVVGRCRLVRLGRCSPVSSATSPRRPRAEAVDPPATPRTPTVRSPPLPR